MDTPDKTRPRRRRRRRGSGRSGTAPAGVAAVGASPSLDDRQDAEDRALERTHLEQAMFRLAREHAEAAARCAEAKVPDRLGELEHSLLAVLMAYFALEAFINMAGQDRLGSRFRYYDRMSPEGKWIEVTRLISKTGETFSESGREMEALSTLRTWRNMLTHYKGRHGDAQGERAGVTQVEALLTARNAARAVEIARDLYRAFYEKDRRSPPRQFMWMDDRPSAPAARVPRAGRHGEARARSGDGRRTPAASPEPEPGPTAWASTSGVLLGAAGEDRAGTEPGAAPPAGGSEEPAGGRAAAGSGATDSPRRRRRRRGGRRHRRRQ